MIVFIVEHKCDDSYYDPYMECAFSTKEKAEEYINSFNDEYEKSVRSINEVELDAISILESK